MALTWDISRTKWHTQDEIAREQEWPVVQAIIMFTMVLGISGITDKNVADVLTRIRFYEKLNGGFLTSRGKDVPIPASIVRALVGMSTNVRPESFASFSRRIVKNWQTEQMHANKEA